MIKLLLVNLLFIFTAAHADTPEADFETNGATKYETVTEWFTGGKSVEYNDIKGFYSGRCFVARSPDKPKPVLLGYIDPKGAVDPGPGFPQPTEPGIMWVVGPTKDEKGDIYDHESTHPEHKRDWLEIIGEKRKHFVVMPGATYSVQYDWENNNRPDELREYVMGVNGYLVAKSTSLFKQSYEEAGVVDVGGTIRMCYFFKKFDDAIAPAKPRPPSNGGGGGGGGGGGSCRNIEQGDRLFPPEGWCAKSCMRDYYDCKCSGGANCGINRAFCDSDCRSDNGRRRR